MTAAVATPVAAGKHPAWFDGEAARAMAVVDPEVVHAAGEWPAAAAGCSRLLRSIAVG